MPKGYWIAHNVVHDPAAYEAYKAANAPAFAAFGARFLVRAGEQQVVEGHSQPRTVVIEFPSLQAAQDCYHSSAYQAAKALRTPISDSDLVIVEGYDA